MHDAGGTRLPERGGSISGAPERRVERERSWDNVAASVYQRAAGESLWFSDRARLVLSLSDLGEGHFSVGGGRTVSGVLQAGELAFYPAHTPVNIVHGSGRLVQVLLKPLVFQDIALEMTGRSTAMVEAMLPFEDPLAIQLVRTLSHEIEGGPANRMIVDCLSTALAVQVLRRIAARPARDREGLSPERMRRVLDYIDANLANDMRLAEVADVACLSPTYFSRCFKRAAGVGLSRYVMRRRIERAKAVIRAKRHSLAAVAQSVGFNDQSYFTTIFLRETGMTPGQYRAAAR